MNQKSLEKQALILNYIIHSIGEMGYSPSVRDICAATGITSTSTVHAYLKKLAEDGRIEMDHTVSRSIRLPSRIHTVEVPIVGKVAAGTPILASENIEDTFSVPRDWARDSDVFMLRVQGDSMIEAGIFHGDLLLVRQQNTAINGDIVVALLDNEATVKTYYRESEHVRLQPENNKMKPILVKDNVSIAGKVIGLYRIF